MLHDLVHIVLRARCGFDANAIPFAKYLCSRVLGQFGRLLRGCRSLALSVARCEHENGETPFALFAILTYIYSDCDVRIGSCSITVSHRGRSSVFESGFRSDTCILSTETP